jgi:hypothetical protein
MRFVFILLMTGCNAILGQHPGIVDAGCPCSLDHATAACSDSGCAILSCDVGYDDLDLDPSDGCESPNPLAFEQGSLALWLRNDQGVVTDMDGGVTGWTNVISGVVQPTTLGAPTVDSSSWPSTSRASVHFAGADRMAVDFSSMSSPRGFTAFVAYARFGNGLLNCIMGSGSYPAGNPTVICPGAAGTAFQLGYDNSNTRAFYEVFCNSMYHASPPNGAGAYQPNLFVLWFDPQSGLNYSSLNGDEESDIKQTPHALVDLSAPGMIGGCPAGATFTGLIGEVVVYSTLLSSSDRAALTSHLKTKWSTP